MLVTLEVIRGGDSIARKIIERREGFFAFPEMMYHFLWPGGGFTTTVRQVGHNEEPDTFWLVFDYCSGMEAVITGQTDWQIFRGVEARKSFLQRPAQG